MKLQEFYISRVVDFVDKHAQYVYEHIRKFAEGNIKNYLRRMLHQHFAYNTIIVMWDKGDIVSVCTFNIYESKAEVIYCIIHPDYRRKQLMQQMTLQALARYPYLETLEFQRWGNNRSDRRHTIKIDRFLKPFLANIKGEQ